jgi:hypothetical protein
MAAVPVRGTKLAWPDGHNMTRKFLFPLLLLSLAHSAIATTITSLVGDIDNLGGAIAPGATSFSGPFDNRSAGELAATNGAQYTDNASQNFGTQYGNPTFVHTFASFTSITSATWEIGVGGVQSHNDRLYVDGILFASGVQIPDQGAFGYGILSWSLSGSALLALLDSSGSVAFNLNSNNSGEPVVFDYAKLTITGTLASSPVPEGGSSLMMIGLAALSGCFWVQRKKPGSVF